MQEYGTVTVMLENGEKVEQEELHCPNCWGKQEYDGKKQDIPLKQK